MQLKASQPPEITQLNTIMIVDSDEYTYNYARASLQAGFTTVSVNNALDFLSSYKSFQPKLIFIDVSIFKKVILDCPTFLDSTTFDQEAQIVVLGLSDQSKEIEWCLSKGANSYLIKPINPFFLIHQINSSFLQIQQKIYLKKINSDLEKIIEEQLYEMQQMDSRLRSLSIEFTKFERIKLNFIRNLNHNIRTHLQSIYLSMHFLNKVNAAIEGNLSSKHSHEITSRIQEISQILDSLASFDRNLSNTLKISPIPTDLSHLCLHIMERQSRFIDKQIVTFTNHCQCLPLITLDASLWRQVLTELLANAIRFSPNGGEIGIQLFQQLEFVKLQIQDEGIGIPFKDMPHIFEPFYRASNANDIPGDLGMGLGLTLVQKIVSLHQGTIKIESKVNQGTKVIISIPLNVEAEGQSEQSKT